MSGRSRRRVHLWAARLAGLALAAATCPAPATAGSTFLLANLDGPGEGLNDPTPHSTAGGNPATTFGEARRRAVEFAFALWANAVDSDVPIRVAVSFDPLGGTATSATLALGGAVDAFRDFVGAPAAGVWYPGPLADRLAGVDLAPGADDVDLVFNSDVDGDQVFGTAHFFYGFDAAPPPGDVDFVAVAAHELAHGLGFTTYLDLATGTKLFGYDDAFLLHLERHGATPPGFPAMTDAERLAALAAGGEVHWTGPRAVAEGAGLTGGVGAGGHLEMHAPDPPQAGSSLTHFTTAVAPDDFMEPYYLGTVPEFSLTLALLEDLGWGAAAACTEVNLP